MLFSEILGLTVLLLYVTIPFLLVYGKLKESLQYKAPEENPEDYLDESVDLKDVPPVVINFEDAA